MNSITFKGLPIDKWIRRRVKVPLPEMGMSVVRLISADETKAKVELKVKGVSKMFQVKFEDLNPNWTENQDLFEEHTKIGSTTHVGTTPLAAALDTALQAKQGHRQEPAKPTVQPPPPSPPQAAKPEPANRTIKNLIVGINAKPEWLQALDDLKALIAERGAHEQRVAEAAKRLEEHDAFINMAIDDLQACNVGIEWEDGTRMTSKPAATPAKKPSAPASATKAQIVDSLAGRFGNANFTSAQAAETLGMKLDKQFYNLFGSLVTKFAERFEKIQGVTTPGKRGHITLYRIIK